MLTSLKRIFSCKNLKDTHKKYYKKDTRDNKLEINDIIAYQLLYSKKDITKKSSSKSVNYDINKDISINAYYEQSKKYSLNFYNDILQQLNISYNEHTDKKGHINKKKIINNVIRNRLNNSICNDFNSLNASDDIIPLLVDGSCSNCYMNHKLHTDNTLFIYDYTHSTCIDTYIKRKSYAEPIKKHPKTQTITKTGKIRQKYTQSNKNNEVRMFMDYINTHHEKLRKMYKNKTIIFICDRAYHCYDLFRLLDSYGFKYIIRIRDNNLLVNDKLTKDKDVLYFRKNARCVAYDIPLNIEYTDLTNNKKKECRVNAKYNIITNLMDTDKFSNKIIEKLYHIRWYIEIYFKFTKKNTKMHINTKFYAHVYLLSLFY